MPRLADPKWELFARNYANGASRTESAKIAGFSPKCAPNTGSRLAKRSDVALRIMELQGDPTIANGNVVPDGKPDQTKTFTKDGFVILQLVETHRAAKSAKQYNVCVQALTRLAELGGLLGEKAAAPRSISQTNIFNMAPQELNGELKKYLGAIPAGERKQLAQANPDLADIIIDVEPGKPLDPEWPG